MKVPTLPSYYGNQDYEQCLMSFENL
jgi:hypothetical protein